MKPFTLSRDEVRELDRRAIHELGVPGIVLMENAGRGVAELLMRLNPKRQEVCIVAGPGNNGGDGFVIARHLQNADWPVRVIYLGLSPPKDNARMNFDIAMRTGLIFDAKLPALPVGAVLIRALFGGDLVPSMPKIEPGTGWFVDALFGTGLTRPVASRHAQAIEMMNASGQPILAVDLPSGLDCDTGEPLGPTVRATHTATFVAPKRGFAKSKAKPFLGEVHVVDIGAPKVLVDEYRRRGIGTA